MASHNMTITFHEFKEQLQEAMQELRLPEPVYVPLVFNVAPGERRRYKETGGCLVLQPTTLDWTRLGSELVFPNVWKLRHKLWKEVKTPEDALAFVNQAGMIWRAENKPVVPADILNVRTFTRLAVTVPPNRWPKMCQEEKLPVNLAGKAWSLKNAFPSDRAGKVHLIYLSMTLRQALLSSVLIDALRGGEYRLCKLARCGTPFEVTGQKKKQFCCERHRQAYAMRRYRVRLHNKSKKEGR